MDLNARMGSYGDPFPVIGGAGGGPKSCTEQAERPPRDREEVKAMASDTPPEEPKLGLRGSRKEHKLTKTKFNHFGNMSHF